MRINDLSKQGPLLAGAALLILLAAGFWSLVGLNRSVNRLLAAEQRRQAAEAAAAVAQAQAAADSTEASAPLAIELLPAEADTTEEPAGPLQLSRAAGRSEISRAYGYDYNPNTEDYRFHRGCDVELAADALIVAPVAATVERASLDQYWGGEVVLDHGDGWKSLYKCLIPSVSSGQRVAAGDTLGTITRAPAEAVQGYHLHVELEQNNSSVNPASYW